METSNTEHISNVKDITTASRRRSYEVIAMLSIVAVTLILFLFGAVQEIVSSPEEGWKELKVINKSATAQPLQDENKCCVFVLYDVEEKQTESYLFFDVCNTVPKKYVETYEMDL